MLWTEDLDGTVKFYVETLGFTANEVNKDWGWASLSLDDKIGFTGTFYFHTDDVDAAWEKLKDNAKVCYELENFEYGMREFAIYDNNGYMLQFGQEIAA